MTPGGTQLTDMVFIVKNGASSCAQVQLSNAATGETVTWANTLAANYWLRFNSQTQRAEVSADSGSNWTKSMANMTGLIPQLKGGVSNVLSLVGPTTGTYDITYTAKG